MVFSRMMTAIFVLLLIGVLSLACIGTVALIGPIIAHGNNVVHADGKIASLGPGMNFTLETAQGERMHFRCATQCRGSLGHLQRHLREHAHTDVYYIAGSNMLVDID